jgi:hypothetical protein
MLTPELNKYLKELQNEKIEEGPHHLIRERLESYDPTIKDVYLLGFEEGLDTFRRIVLAEIELGNISLPSVTK